MIVVSVIAAAAMVDAVIGEPSPKGASTPRGSVESTTAPTTTATTTTAVTLSVEESPPIRPCKERQLGLRADVRDDPAVVLFHRAGRECTLRPLRITVRIFTASGARGEGTLFGPEPDVFRGFFESVTSEVAAFRYSPACGEKHPFFANVTAGRYVAKMRIPVLRCGQVIPGDAARRIVSEFLRARIHGAGAEAFLTREARSDFNPDWWDTGLDLHPLYAPPETSYKSFRVVFIDRLSDESYEVGYRLRGSPHSFSETVFVIRDGSRLKIGGGRLGLTGP